MRQAQAAVAAVDRIVRRERVAMLIDVRYAWAEGGAFEKHVKQLQREHEVPTASERPTTDQTPRQPLSAMKKGDH